MHRLSAERHILRKLARLEGRRWIGHDNIPAEPIRRSGSPRNRLSLPPAWRGIYLAKCTFAPSDPPPATSPCSPPYCKGPRRSPAAALTQVAKPRIGSAATRTLISLAGDVVGFGISLFLASSPMIRDLGMRVLIDFPRVRAWMPHFSFTLSPPIFFAQTFDNELSILRK